MDPIGTLLFSMAGKNGFLVRYDQYLTVDENFKKEFNNFVTSTHPAIMMLTPTIPDIFIFGYANNRDKVNAMSQFKNFPHPYIVEVLEKR
jgi:hypothetical protein